ncbi:MAG TPA: helical backbone metal receptor [Thermoanaerobaculia bacterium]|jgi:ABC-type Fe3+-hydroxamate transport system substrate-binding protein|nr:MAG: vitamin B12-transporter protein BtuF [Acidobacteria bacterium ADurb.Bin051]HNU82453.1 helical backbone metal receptor [Thermoanaerobaculia bacterium]
MPDVASLRDALGTEHPPAAAGFRIVSLVPSLTELVCDLGLAAHLVGRTGFCIHPRAAVATIPKMGGTKDPDFGKIRAARPTHLLVNVDENRREQIAELARTVPHVIVTHPNRPEENLDLFHLFGGLFHREREAERLAADFRAAREELRQAVAALPRERVLYLIWKNPWMTVSRATYISAMLAAAGWDTEPAASVDRYPRLPETGEEPGPLDHLLLATEPYRFTSADFPLAEARFAAPARLVDGELLSWYGSRAAAGLRYLARLRTA